MAALTDEPAGSEALLDPLFARLTREPDFDADELQAFDAADHLILRTAADDLADRPLAEPLAPGEVVVIGDRHGALTLGAAVALDARGIRTHQDPLLGERALAQNAARLGLADRFAAHPLAPELVRGARVVLLQLPRGLDALAEISGLISAWAADDVRVFAGGRVKHLSRRMNTVLEADFGTVSAGLGWRKSRVLRAAEPRRTPGADDRFPRWGSDADLGFRVAAYGATFGGPTLDHGSRLLLETLQMLETPGALGVPGAPGAPSETPRRIVDLGCGNGVLAVSAALRFPDAEVVATDQSAAAVEATLATAQAAGVADRVAVHRADALEAVGAGWADLILLNPPFHTGATVHAGVGQRLIRACGEALAPGGELRLVYNSHLRYRPLVEREIGPARQRARSSTFTVLAASRRG